MSSQDAVVQAPGLMSVAEDNVKQGMSPVNIEVFHIDDCPNTMIALKRVEDALAALG